MKTAIHFGAGNIGRGFIGSLLSQAGYRVVFADINPAVIEALRREAQYPLYIVDEQVSREVITGVTGVMSDDEALLDEAEQAELITTAVGPVALGKLAVTLSLMLRRRREKGITAPVNIIACENMTGAGTSLKNAVMKYLSREEREEILKYAGFPNAVVDRIVPPARPRQDEPLAVDVEPFFEWIVERRGFAGAIPPVPGMDLTDNLPAYVERKLFTLNTGHALTAYLGWAAGYSTIRESISDEKILATVLAGMEESGKALIHRHGFDAEAHGHYVRRIINRFRNPYLDDQVERVCREPLRKLSGTDRLIRPLLLCREAGIEPQGLVQGIAAALRYQSESDPQSVQLQKMIRDTGVAAALEKAAGTSIPEDLMQAVLSAYHANESSEKQQVS